MRWVIIFIVLAGVSANTADGQARGLADGELRAGVGRVKITPELPMWLTGYAGRDQPATEVLQDIWAKALVLEDRGAGVAGGRGGPNRVVIVTTDLLGISHEISVEVAR